LSLIQYYGTGKRKSSIARVFLRTGKGEITLFVNKRARNFEDYFNL
jgi:small subunit ribosomal protein S9